MKPREIKIQGQKFNVGEKTLPGNSRETPETFHSPRRHFTDAQEAHIVNRIKLLVFPVNIRVSFCSAGDLAQFQTACDPLGLEKLSAQYTLPSLDCGWPTLHQCPLPP